MMHEELRLEGVWELRDERLSADSRTAAQLTHLPDGWIPTPVPGAVHQGLLAAGRLKEPLVGLNSFDCRWVEDRSWWYRKLFTLPSGWLDSDIIELELHNLDSNAELFLNGAPIGSHRNAFRPLILDVSSWLRDGENVLLVRLSSGTEAISTADVDGADGFLIPTEASRGRPERGDPRRVLVRKPQYSFGWDWHPRVATIGLAGQVVLRALRTACIRQVNLLPDQHASGAVTLHATVLVEQLHYYKTTVGVVELWVTDAQGRQQVLHKQTLLRSGSNFVELSLTLEHPRLWWPNGAGEQHLYRVSATLRIGENQMHFPEFEYGIRFIELVTDDAFAIVVNGKKLFCQGANWIPADSIYPRVTDEDYVHLIQEARAANFNMLRVWGGGRYESEAFYNACDRAGILVWQDFMFACAPYPDHLDWFRREVELEADFQTKRLREHACIALWCGNNESNWMFDYAWHEETRGGAWLYNYLLPQIAHRNCPNIPYWNGSPYGGSEPNSSEVGDRHHWYECMMNPEMASRIAPECYDECNARFASEFGYVGAVAKASVLTYLDGQINRGDAAWQHHTNTFEQDTVAAGIGKHYADPAGLSLDDYLLYSGLTQGIMYGYAFEALRAKADCSGCLFWMYNDCWGEIGWSVIDYYHRRKPAWYFTRRAYAPVRLILRDGSMGTIRVIVANGTSSDCVIDLEYGYVKFDGAANLQRTQVAVPPFSRSVICEFERGTHDKYEGLWMARTVNHEEIVPAIYRAVDFRDLKTSVPHLSLSYNSQSVRVASDVYAHAVHFVDLPLDVLPSDNYFDLLPGESRIVTFNRAIESGSLNLRSVH